VKTITLLALALPLLAAAPLAAMTADELIEKGFEAQGGLENIQAIKSVKATGKFMTMGMEFPFTMVQKRPGMMRIDADINGMTMVQVWDGEAGWSINPMMGSTEAQDMSPMEAKSFKMQADMDGVLVDYEKKGYSVEYVGEDEVEGTKVHHLKLDTNDDLVLDMYYDAEYFLVIKTGSTMTMDEQTIKSDTFMSDFKESGDLIVPFAMETRMNGQTMNNIVIETIEYDVEVDDGQFVRPASN
jgi:hypothetical protein